MQSLKNILKTVFSRAVLFSAVIALFFCLFLALQPLNPFAKTDFIRNCWLLSVADDAPFTAEFAIDVGTLGNARGMQPFEELELEFKSGDEAAFHRFAAQLSTRFSLAPQPLSKLARAVRV